MQEDDEMLLKSLQDLVPDDVMDAELSGLDDFCLDPALLPPETHNMPAAASTFRPGNTRSHPVNVVNMGS